MRYALNLDDYYLDDKQKISASPKKERRSDGKICSNATDVKNSSLDDNNKTVPPVMKSFSYPIYRNENQLDDEFTLETPCFDFFPVLKDIESPRDNLDIRWQHIWGRVFFSMKQAIKDVTK